MSESRAPSSRGVLYLGIAALLGIALHLVSMLWRAAHPLSIQALLMFAMLAYLLLLARGSSIIYRAAEERVKQVWLLRIVVALAGVALIVLRPHDEGSGISSGVFTFAPSGTMFLLGASLLVPVFFYVLSGLLLALTKQAGALRVRMVWLALASAVLSVTASVIFHDHIEVNGGVSALVRTSIVLSMTLLLCLPLTLGFARLASRHLTEMLGRTRDALGQVGRGQLDVQLPVEGRDELAEMNAAFNTMVVGLKERVFLEQAFGRYASPAVLAALRQAGGLTVHTERREATVLYADIRGFTAWSEQVAPEEVMRALNRYFERIVRARNTRSSVTR
jgi:adenylate cyclase